MFVKWLQGERGGEKGDVWGSPNPSLSLSQSILREMLKWTVGFWMELSLREVWPGKQNCLVFFFFGALKWFWVLLGRGWIFSEAHATLWCSDGGWAREGCRGCSSSRAWWHSRSSLLEPCPQEVGWAWVRNEKSSSLHSPFLTSKPLETIHPVCLRQSQFSPAGLA